MTRLQHTPILIVDDNRDCLHALAAILDHPDYQIITTGSGQEALECLLNQEVALILLDVHMPEMNGLETARLIRQRDKTHDVPIIFFSGDVRDFDSISQGYALNAIDYMLKPFNHDIMRTKVRVLAELYQKRLQIEQQAEQLEQDKHERERLMLTLNQKNNELAQLIYATSHDLRSPLVNIQGFTHELDYLFQDIIGFLQQQEALPEELEQQMASFEQTIAEIVQYILAGTAKMDTMLSGLLRLSRLGRAALKMEVLQMNELLSNVVNTFGFQIKEAAIELTISDLVECSGDAAQIHQVFSNLLGNALKYLDSKRPGMIRIDGYADGASSIYAIEDNGVGIAPEHQQHIFDLFYRLNPDEKPGEGLGLTIVRKILERHNGEIWLTSEPGVGSTFYVSLPKKMEKN